MKSALGYINFIFDTQTGFLKGKYTSIWENTKIINDSISYTENKNKPGLLVLIDFDKAFDSVSRSFIYKAL